MSSSKRPAMPSRDVEYGGPSETHSLLDKGRTKVTRFFHGFVDFAFQGNILQLAFGLMWVLVSFLSSYDSKAAAHA